MQCNQAVLGHARSSDRNMSLYTSLQHSLQWVEHRTNPVAKHPSSQKMQLSAPSRRQHCLLWCAAWGTILPLHLHTGFSCCLVSIKMLWPAAPSQCKVYLQPVKLDMVWHAGWGTSLFLQAQAGLLVPWGSSWQSKPTCISDRFYLGGVTSLRGFYDKQAGPSEARLGPNQVGRLQTHTTTSQSWPTCCFHGRLFLAMCDSSI